MKKIIILILLNFPILIFAQVGVSDIEIGKQYTIYFKDGNTLTGTIKFIDAENVKIEFKSINTELTYKLNDIKRFEKIKIPKIGSFGVGFGIEYGVCGFNIETNLTNHLALSAGIGSTIFAGIGYNIGSKFYFSKTGKTWRPRIEVYYGTNSMLMTDIDLTDLVPGAYYKVQTFKGFTVGLGQVWWLGIRKRNGLSFDILYLFLKEAKDKIKEINTNVDLYNERAENTYYLDMGKLITHTQ